MTRGMGTFRSFSLILLPFFSPSLHRHSKEIEEYRFHTLIKQRNRYFPSSSLVYVVKCVNKYWCKQEGKNPRGRGIFSSGKKVMERFRELSENLRKSSGKVEEKGKKF